MGMSKHQYHDDIVLQSENFEYNHAQQEHDDNERRRLARIKKNEELVNQHRINLIKIALANPGGLV